MTECFRNDWLFRHCLWSDLKDVPTASAISFDNRFHFYSLVYNLKINDVIHTVRCHDFKGKSEQSEIQCGVTKDYLGHGFASSVKQKYVEFWKIHQDTEILPSYLMVTLE